MRNELAVSFFLCIGLTSGYTVPSSITEHTQEKKYSATTESTSAPCDKKIKKSRILDLQNARNAIKDSEILSQGGQNPNNINSRSFIFIRQKFRSPMLNLYHSQIQNPLPHDSAKLARINLESDKFEELSRRFSPLNLVNVDGGSPVIDNMSKALDKTQGILLNHLCSNRLKLEKDGTITKMTDSVKLQHIDKVANENREYIELLKTPLLRPNYDDHKTSLQEKRQMFEVSKIPPNLRNHETLQKMSLDVGQTLAKKYNREYRPYKSKHAFYNSEVAKQHEERDNSYNLENSVSSKSSKESKEDSNQYVKYSKNNLEATLQDEKGSALASRNHYCHDCTVKNFSYQMYPRSRIHSDCKCGSNVYMRAQSEWNNQGKQIRPNPIIPLDTHLVTVRINGRMHSKDDRTSVNAAPGVKQSRF